MAGAQRAPAMSSLSATEIAFLMVAFQQGVLACGWLAGAALMPDSRSASLHWAAYAALSALSLGFFVAGVQPGDDVLRALGALCIVASLIALQRGVWSFFGEPRRWRGHAAVGALVLVAVVFGMGPAQAAMRVTLISGLLGLLCFWAGWDLQAAARRHLALRWGAVLAVPIAVAGVVFTLRAGRAVLDPDAVAAMVTANSALNIGSAVVYLVVSLVFQLTLVALVVTRLVDKLHRASRFDALTGLLNRRAIEEALHAEIGRARRLGEPFSVVMVDADHFKAINDGAGHAAGDRALQHLGTLLATLMRDIDRAGRWGGEEFLVLLPGTTGAEALPLAERLRERAEALPPRWQDRAMPLTLSIGVAQWRSGGDDLQSLLARADAALYRAKAAGRNRVEGEAVALSAVA
jgi:diguanylate cyclase (GGDEF)-like protein